jgi:hypothetical protein
VAELERRTFASQPEAATFVSVLKRAGIAPYTQNRGRTVIWDTAPQVRATTYPWAIWMDGSEHTVAAKDLTGSVRSWLRTARNRARAADGHLHVDTQSGESATFRYVPNVVSPSKYPWDVWADGEWHTIHTGRGEYRLLTVDKLVSAVRSQASARKVGCEVAKPEPGVVRFRVGDQQTP